MPAYIPTCLPLLFALMGIGVDDVVVVDRPGIEIAQSCRIEIRVEHFPDADDSGAIRITGSDILVDFSGAHLRGAAAATDPDAYAGYGLVITGQNVTLRNARVSGFKCGIFAHDAHGLVIEDCDISDNFRQRLRSTPQAEDAADWIYPHHNDNLEWLSRYGAGLYVQSSDDITVRRVRARNGQNGIILDHVNDSRIYDNDCSFLSGWGLALWRSSRNVITRNAFDFCVRGYSHGVYNRGQDSAGILFFEQCSENIVAENSATHGGDGFFGFAGLEALGEKWVNEERDRLRREHGRQDVDDVMVYPADLLDRVHRAGNNSNLLINNDFSYAVAHGIEMTFSFDNQFIGNRLVGNAICGVWGGYSQSTLIALNTFENNGEAPYGLERGGINIEHGIANRIIRNTFRNNKCGVHLWWDPDDGLMLSPWAKANHPEMPRRADGSIERTARAEGRMVPSADNDIIDNEFTGDVMAIQLRETDSTFLSRNEFIDVDTAIAAENEPVTIDDSIDVAIDAPEYPVFGESQPIGARAHLAGREFIIITEWGPYDWVAPMLQPLPRDDAKHAWRLLGGDRLAEASAIGDVDLARTGDDGHGFPVIEIRANEAGRLTPYTLEVRTDGGERLRAEACLVPATWRITVFAWTADPREHEAQWHAEAEEVGHTFTIDSASLRLEYGGGGPSDLRNAPQTIRDAGLPRDRFGTLVSTRLTIPSGTWRIVTTSDDGIRVWIDDEMVIDDWTHHAPRRHTAEITFDDDRTVDLRIEHFELTGFAVLTLDIEPAGDSPLKHRGH